MFNLPQNQAILLQFLKPSADHSAKGQYSGRRAKTSASNTSTTTTTGWELTNSSYLCLNSFLFTMKQPTCCPEQEVSVILHLEKLQKKQGWYLSFFFFLFSDFVSSQFTMHALHTVLEETMAEAISLNGSWPSSPCFILK